MAPLPSKGTIPAFSGVATRKFYEYLASGRFSTTVTLRVCLTGFRPYLPPKPFVLIFNFARQGFDPQSSWSMLSPSFAYTLLIF